MHAPAKSFRWEEMHYRLVSLWDIIMLELNSRKLVEGLQVCATTMQSLEMSGVLNPGSGPLGIPVAGYALWRGQIVGLIEEAKRLDLDVVYLNTERTLEVYERCHASDSLLDTHNARIAHGALRVVTVAARDQFEARTVLVVPASKADFYDPAKEPLLFGEEVWRKFKRKGRFEIAEAGKCLALSRSTACVFHLMRSVEVVLEAIAICLQLPPPRNKYDKTWGAVLGRYQDELDGREDLLWPRQWNSMKDKKVFGEIHASLLVIKDNWRDPTMHLESTYDENGALHLWALVKGFMQKVASRLDEDGQPLA
jgi:hypothetical protein